VRICGAEISGASITLLVAEINEDRNIAVDKQASTKITMGKTQDDVRRFLRDAKAFIENQKIEAIKIKGRAGRGQYAGGAIGFKIEALLESVDNCEVSSISPNGISSRKKKNGWDYPNDLFQYQHTPFDVLMAGFFHQ